MYVYAPVYAAPLSVFVRGVFWAPAGSSDNRFFVVITGHADTNILQKQFRYAIRYVPKLNYSGRRGHHGYYYYYYDVA